MSLINKIISTVAPHDCLGCGRQGALLCSNCSQQLQPPPKTCYRCHQPIQQFCACSVCLQQTHVSHIYAVSAYTGLAKDLVWKLKFGSGQMAAKQMASLMKNILNYSQNMIINPVPTATSRVRSRGYDQAALLARELSRVTRLPQITVLGRLGQAHQVGADREQRIQQLSRAYFVKKPAIVRGAHILLVDDVLTTGSTLETAATTLKNAGAQQVDAIIFAQA